MNADDFYRAGEILAVAALVLTTRAAGFYQKNTELPEFWVRFFRYAPFGAFVALVVPGLSGPQGIGIAQLGGALAAALSVKLTRQAWVGLAVGMVCFWLLRALLPQESL